MATPPDFVAGQVLTAAQMNKIGNWLITSQSFSAVSSVSVNNCFSADFVNYQILARFTNSNAGPQALTFRVRAAGTDATTNYDSNAYRSFGATSSATSVDVEAGGYNTNVARYANASNIVNGYNFSVIDISGPFLAENTLFLSKHCMTESATSSVQWDGGWYNDNLTSYDGFTLSVAAGTITGTLYVYGVNV